MKDDTFQTQGRHFTVHLAVILSYFSSLHVPRLYRPGETGSRVIY